MKTFQSLSVLLMTALVLSSCSAKQPLTGGQKTQNPFGETFEAPCQVYDTKQNFAASTSFRGSSMQRNEVQKNALLAAQDLIRLKMQHAYVGMVSEYSASVGNNRGNDIERKMSSAGDRIIDAIINETLQSCVRWSGIYDDGDIECYIAIEISKEETARRISKEVKDHLTQDEKDRIGFNEQVYREQMQKRFEEYKENQ